ncbi:MAG: MATE family efflux transporter [Alphaproteobacteria bacterium]|nr:MATE family efflux transporter [Alphaproteobacteria bacterium]
MAQTLNIAAASSWRGEAQATVSLALPLAGAQLAHIAHLTTDMVMMGWLGPEALAAGALAFNVYITLLLFGIGLATAVAPVAAQAMGRGAARDAQQAVRHGLWLSLWVSLPVSLLLWETERLLLRLGQDPGNAALAGDYGRALMWGYCPVLGYVVLRCFVSVHGHTRILLAISLAGILLNAALVYVLMFGHLGFPALGVVGAGISTSLVNLLSFLGLLIYVLAVPGLDARRMLRGLARVDGRGLRELIAIGWPIGLTLMVEVSLFSGAAMLMGLIGTHELAAHQIAIQWASITFMVPLGVAQAATVRIGLAAGRRDTAGIRRAGWTAIAFGLLFMGVAAALFWTVPRLLVAPFLDAAAPDTLRVTDLAQAYLAIAALFQLLDAAQGVALGALRGLKDTRMPMLIAGFGYWLVGLPVSALLAFPFGLQGEGVWLGIAFGLAVVATLLVARFHAMTREPAVIC